MSTATLFSAAYHYLSQNGAYSTAIIAAVLTIGVIVAFWGTNKETPYPGFPLVGQDQSVKTTIDAKKVWKEKAKSLIFDTLRKTGRSFQVMGINGPLIILADHHMDEVRNDERMTFSAWLQKDFFTAYPGFEGFRPATNGHVFNDSVRVGLTQSLAQTTGTLNNEMASTLKDLWPLTDDWVARTFTKDAMTIIARLSARTFLPEPLCHDPEWLRISIEYTIHFFTAAFTLRMVPPPLRPVMHWFLPQTRKARKDVEIATRLIQPEVDARKVEAEKCRREGRTYVPPVDAITWLTQTAEKQGVSNYNVVWGQLNYSLGAIHTTTNTFINVVYDVVAYNYADLLREEINSVGWAPGDPVNKSLLLQLKLMDSFMKESQRLNPVTLIPVNRMAHQDITLKDGTTIPKGAVVGIPITAMTDSKFQDDPNTFNGHRFYNKRQQPGNENKFQFVTTSNDHIAFGHGKHACPGRFFASNEIKIALMHILMKYDITFPEDQGRPQSIESAVSLIHNPNAKLLIRKRKA